MIEPLTPREKSIVKLLGQGMHPAAIAPTLGLKLSSVRLYISRIREKTGLKMREIAVKAARGELG